MSLRVALIAEHCRNEVGPATFELMAAATRLLASSPGDIRLLLAGSSIRPAAEQLAARCGCPVLGLELGSSVDYLQEQSAAALAAEIGLDPPDYVCIAHTVRGVCLAGTLAAGLEAACITGVEEIVKADNALQFRRSTNGGKFVATIASNAPTTILTIQPGAFEPLDSIGASEKEVAIKDVAPPRGNIKLAGQKPAVAGAADLANASVIIAAGQGIGEQDNLDLIRRLAACFPKAAVAGSRIVCDLGWLNYNRQVGVSGNTVAPDLYFACGISGAVQHLMGMRGSKFVVAVNTDPTAPIFREADVCIVEDLKTFIPAFIDALDRSE